MIALTRTVASILLGVEEALATECGRSREQHFRRALARVDDRHAGSLVRIAELIQAPLEFQIAFLFISVARVVANVMEIAALGHLSQGKIFLI